MTHEIAPGVVLSRINLGGEQGLCYFVERNGQRTTQPGWWTAHEALRAFYADHWHIAAGVWAVRIFRRWWIEVNGEVLPTLPACETRSEAIRAYWQARGMGRP